MPQLPIAPIQEAAFQARAVLDGDEIAVQFLGTANLDVGAKMDRFLVGVHAEAIRLRTTTVNVDISELEFINSSCLLAVANWITEVQALARPYRISFHFKAIRDWHRRSFGVLAQLGEEVVTLQHQPVPDRADNDAPPETTTMVRPARPK